MIKKLYFYIVITFIYGSIVTMEDPRPNNSLVHQNQNIWESDSIKTEIGKIKDIQYNCFGNKIVVIGQNSNFAQIWNTKTKELIAKLEGHTDKITCCAFHPTKDILVTGGQDDKAIIWDASDGKKLTVLNTYRFNNHAFTGGAITAVAFSGKGNLLLTGTSKGQVFLWRTNGKDLRRWPWQECLPIPDQELPITCIRFGIINKIIFVATEKGSFYAYCRKDKNWIPVKAPCYDEAIDNFKISSDERFIAITFKTTDNIKDYRIIDLVTSKTDSGYKVIDHEQKVPIDRVSLKQDNLVNYLFSEFHPTPSCSAADEFIEIRENAAVIYKTNRNYIKEQHILSHDNNTDLVTNAIYDSRGQRIATTASNQVKIWTEHEKWQCDDNITCDYIIDHILFNPNDSNIIITTSLDGDIITIWKTKGTIKKLDKHSDQAEQSNSVTDNNKKRDVEKKTKKTSNAPISKRRKLANIPQDAEILPVNLPAVTAENIVADNQNIQQSPTEDIAEAEELKTLELMYDLISSDQEIFEKSLGQVIALHTLDIVKKYLELQKSDVNSLDNSGQAPIHIAINNKKLDTLKFLLMCKANINTKNSAGFTLLHIAIEQNNEELAKYLIDNGADINAQTLDNTTPLHMAVKNKSLNIIKMLLDAKANIYIKDSNSLTPVSMVIQSKDIALIRVFGQQLFKK